MVRPEHHRDDNEDDSMDIDVVHISSAPIRLKTSDGKRFTLTESEAFCSKALKQMIENCAGADNSHNNHGKSSDYIQLPSIVDSQTMSSILQWCQAHSNYTTESQDQAGELTDWDKAFLNSFKEETLLRLMQAANYLDVTSLYDACCRVMARHWEGKTVEEIRDLYNIANDFTYEEENQNIQEVKKLGL